jgi:hypothetical protein
MRLWRTVHISIALLGRSTMQLPGWVWQLLNSVLMPAGDTSSGSSVHAALKRLKQLHAMVKAGQRLPSAAWQQLDEDLRTLVDSAQQRQKLQQQVDVNIQKHEQAMFRRLAQLQQQLQQQ